MSTEIQRRTHQYVLSLSLAACAIGMWLILDGYTLGGAPWTIAALILVNAIAERSGVWITRTTQLSIALLPTLFAAVLFGPLAAAVVNASAMLGDPDLLARSDPERAPRLKLASYASSRFITGAAAGLVAQQFTDVTADEFGTLLIATLAAAFTAECLDMLFAALTARIRGPASRSFSRP